MRITNTPDKKPLTLTVGDLVYADFVHMVKPEYFLVAINPTKGNIYLLSLNGRTQFYGNRNFKTLRELHTHMKQSSSIRGFEILKADNFTMKIEESTTI